MALLTIDKCGRQIPIAFGLASLVLSPSALSGPPINDNCEDAIWIGLADTTFSTIGAATDGLPHSGQCSPGGAPAPDIWFTYKADFSGVLQISTCNQADFNTKIACYLGCDPENCPPTTDDLIGCNNIAPGCAGGTSELAVEVEAGECYMIRVGSTGTSVGTGTLTLTKGHPACPGLGACDDANGSPGCDAATCCNVICSVEPSCCDETWTQSCADLAVDMCVALPQTCDVEGNANLTQNADLTIVDLSGVACATAGTSVDNYFARSYDLSQIPGIVDQDYTVHCVEVGIEVNTGSDLISTVTVYVDTDGGAPTAAGIDLWPLGSKDLLIPTGTDLEILLVHFDSSILVPAKSVMVVELFYPVHTNGGVWPGVNSAPESGPTYIMAPDCGVDSYTTMADVGFPEVHWVQRIIGTTCRWDLDGDGSVGILDMLALLAAWGTDPGGPPDFDGDGTVGILDLLALLANWGPCL